MCVCGGIFVFFVFSCFMFILLFVSMIIDFLIIISKRVILAGNQKKIQPNSLRHQRQKEKGKRKRKGKGKRKRKKEREGST